MNPAQAAQLAEIEALIAERRKIEQWLATLESRREGTPAHVYARVLEDYTAKCEAAQSALQDKMDAVRSVANSLELTLTEQDAAISQRRDVRAEVELRALVGEFTPEEWDSRRQQFDDELADMQAARDVVARELDVMFGLLAEAKPVFVPAALPVVEAPVVSVAPLPEPQTAVEGAPESAPDVGSTDERQSEPVESSQPELFVPDVVHAERAEGRELLEVPQPPSAVERAPTVPTPHPVMAATAPHATADAARTLTCQECKALNFPTEWYCEKCGGELAAY